MARGESSDLMMKIIDLDGKPIPAESTTQLLMNSSNELLAGFDKALEAKGLIRDRPVQVQRRRQNYRP